MNKNQITEKIHELTKKKIFFIFYCRESYKVSNKKRLPKKDKILEKLRATKSTTLEERESVVSNNTISHKLHQNEYPLPYGRTANMPSTVNSAGQVVVKKNEQFDGTYEHYC